MSHLSSSPRLLTALIILTASLRGGYSSIFEDEPYQSVLDIGEWTILFSACILELTSIVGNSKFVHAVTFKICLHDFLKFIGTIWMLSQFGGWEEQSLFLIWSHGLHVQLYNRLYSTHPNYQHISYNYCEMHCMAIKTMQTFVSITSMHASLQIPPQIKLLAWKLI